MYLANVYNPDWFIRIVHKQGKILTDSGVILINSALFDSGALGASYISKHIVDTNIEALRPYIRTAKGTVKLAADGHLVQITQAVLLDVLFCDQEGCEHKARILFFVLPSHNNDMVIGLPAIITCFGAYFLDMIKRAVDECAMSDSSLHNVEANSDSDLVYPWSIPVEEEAPEDLATPLPCAFTDALYYMEMSFEEAKAEYFSQFDEHIALPFRETTDVINLLKTKGVKVFVPNNWEGVRNIPPIELAWKEGMPDRVKPKPRPVNPRLFEQAKKEFDRLMLYFYRFSTSPIASCLVIAPKATKPFIRFAGDYHLPNKYLEIGHYPIPHVMRSLEKISQFPIKLDFDLVNSFHQFRLAELTSKRLSIVTPWGQVEPKFLPEGVGPASFVLQSAMDTIFGDFSDWSIVIFDNLLVLATDYEDAYRKVDLILDRCIEYNLFLKFAKTWLGFEEVKFFGYRCKRDSYELDDDRYLAIEKLPLPTTCTQMQSLLGAALFFKSFVPSYSTITAPLTEMTHKDFVWNDKVWTEERLEHMRIFKQALKDAVSVYYPDYELSWILRTDASLWGIGYVLYQVKPDPNGGEPQHQIIRIGSSKFSKQASRWPTIEQEAYAPYFAVKDCQYYLRCKDFVLETDHRNLLWMEASEVPKIIRWRVYLQSFTFMIRHIKGNLNNVADYMSRHGFSPEEVSSDVLASIMLLMLSDDFTVEHLADVLAASTPTQLALVEPEVLDTAGTPVSPDDIISKVHGGRSAHHGIRRTWLQLNQHFPGHRIPLKTVAEFVERCPICQKNRLGMTDALEPIYRTLKPEHRRKRVGVDVLTITPADKLGNKYCVVITVHATKFVDIYPFPTHDALSLATALFQFYARFGVFEEIISDPGSDMTSEMVAHLHEWFGIRHKFSLVDRHESNGVEGTNGSILDHLRAIVADERVVDRWSDPTVLPFIIFVLNAMLNSETGAIPHEAMFGSEDATYLRMPELAKLSESTHEFVRLLNENLRLIWKISKDYQDKLVKKREGKQSAETQNQYQPGDLILLRRSSSKPLPTKLSLRYLGPYEVISQYKNDIECRHLCMKTVETFHVSRVKMYYLDNTPAAREAAFKAAQLDYDQYVVTEIAYYRGNPTIRTTMEFFVRFADGDERWVTWNQDLADTIQFEDFCRSRSPLYPLLFKDTEAKKMMTDIRRRQINEVKPNDQVFIDLRFFGGATWYNDIGLPDAHKSNYVLPCKYGAWRGTKKLSIWIDCRLTGDHLPMDHYDIKAYGLDKVFVPERMVLVTKALIEQYPLILPTKSHN